jgi:glutamyl-tRNA reductase
MAAAPQLEHALRSVGLAHYTAPVALRERLAFRASDLPRALNALLARGFQEAAILSTCNRVEVFAVARADTADPGRQMRAFLSEFHGIGAADFAKALYEYSGAAVAQHLFEVTASLDSQVLGETEILAQAKEAYRVAAEAGACGPALRRLFERSFFLSKELRGEGGLVRAQASVSSAAVTLANKLFDVKGRKVLVVGTGEMATGIVRALRAAGAADLTVLSRTAERAAEFAAHEGGTPCDIRQLPEQLIAADIVLVSAAAPDYIIKPPLVNAAAGPRRGRALCLIDISVPRNVDPAVGELEDTFLYDIDDLESVAAEGRRERERIAGRWRPRFAEEARELVRQADDWGVQEATRELLVHMNSIREDVLGQAHTSGLDPKAAEQVSRALERFQGRVLHGPLETMKQAAREGDGANAASWVSRLFRLGAKRGAADDTQGKA